MSSLAPRMFLLLTVVGCGTTTPDAGLPIEGIEAAYVRAACSSLSRCPGTTETAQLQSLVGGLSTCATRIAPLLTDRVNDLVRAIRAGRIRYNGVLAESCLARASLTCNTDLNLERLCPDAFTGTLAEGTGCWRTQECVPTAWCDHGSTFSCPGVCRPRLLPGGACTSSSMCMAAAPLKALCVEGRCVSLGVGTPVGENQACGPTQGASANEWLQVNCQANLACFTNLMPRPLCRRLLSEGTPCEAGDTCVYGTACVESSGTTTRSCRRLNVMSREGDRCDGAVGTMLCNPLVALACNEATSACARIGDGAEGSACIPGDLSLSCVTGLYCDSVTRRCVGRRGVGQTCTRDAECQSAECLDGRCLERICD